MSEGPALSALLHRLAECPPIFLEEPRIGAAGRIHVAAIVADLLRSYDHDPDRDVNVTRWSADDLAQRNRLRLTSLACWLIADDGIRSAVRASTPVYSLLANGLDELARVVDVDKLMASEERREELVRHCLFRLGLRPAGESERQAEHRLTTLSSVEQQRILRETEQARRRAEEIRAALKQKAAQEAAAKVSRE